MKKKKERRGLAFRMTREFMNYIFDMMKKRKYKLIPKDTQIHSISNEPVYFNTYTVIMTSKEFPIVEEGKQCALGCFGISKEKGIIDLYEIEKE